SQTIPMMIVADRNYYYLSALYILCDKTGLQIFINGYKEILIKHSYIDILGITIESVSTVTLHFIRAFEKSEIMHRNLLI
ncbi:hypothetical protein J4U89_02985, partial [Escherichia coli]